MNERIKQIAHRATREVWNNNPYNGAPELEGYELDQEKFAELIVRECAGIDFRHKVGMTIDQECDTSRVILEHFGVK